MPTAELVLLHAPLPVASVSVVVAPTHTAAVPVMLPALGNGLTVTTVVAATVPQPPVTVYDMVVVPTAMPVTTPRSSAPAPKSPAFSS